MKYLITEDSGSGKVFWKTVFETFLPAGDFELVELKNPTTGIMLYGNYSLKTLFKETLKKTNSGDYIFIAFDNVEGRKETEEDANIDSEDLEDYYIFDPEEFISNAYEKCIEHDVNLRITKYYCFEEIYLSYAETVRLYSMVDKRFKDEKILEILEYVQKHIMHGTEYYDKNGEYVKYLSQLSQGAIKNKEHFADVLLYQSTRRIHYGLFMITKRHDTMFNCWIQDCEDLRKRKKKVRANIYACNTCPFIMKNSITREKLLDLEKNSLVENMGIKFTTLSTLK